MKLKLHHILTVSSSLAIKSKEQRLLYCVFPRRTRNHSSRSRNRRGVRPDTLSIRARRISAGDSVASSFPNEDLFNLTRGNLSLELAQPRPSVVFQGTPVYALVGRRLPIRDRTTCFIAVYTYAVSTPTPAVTAPIYKQCCDNYIEAERFLGTVSRNGFFLLAGPSLRSMQTLVYRELRKKKGREQKSDRAASFSQD